MPKVSRWKQLFGSSKKPEVTVQVGGTPEKMTDTQAYRFDELTQSGSLDTRAVKRDVDGPARYSLEDAAFRLMTSEADVLQRAVAGSIRFYIDATGLAGHWRRFDDNGVPIESSPRVLQSGFLGLTELSCKELALRDGTSVLVFEFPDVDDASVLDFEVTTLQELTAWGDGKKVFCVSEPRWVERNNIVLLAPLAGQE